MAEVGLERCRAIRRFFTLLFLLAAFAGCSDEIHFGSPDTPKNLSARYRRDVFWGWGVDLRWEDTNSSDDIGFTVYRDGMEVAVVGPVCLGWEDHTCTDFMKFTSCFDSDVTRGKTYCYAVSAHYFGVLDASIFGDSDLSPETCITIPVE